MNGIVAVMSRDSGKCIDHRLLSKKCSMCHAWQNRKGTPGCHRVIANIYGKCAINFTGAIKSTGVVSCFQESVEGTHNKFSC